ncbi:ABC transporter permease [uncultured Roseivirga sp.]|uniref:ABC transporter permease n=1 Tax=uncultured Roseivirga sp. TaxID=543088 RepID=UPI0030D80549|tara:strand:+ start:22603 stop:24969 length:2367 start_codon:yes stop_codon:yes gene_type:complete
MLAKPLYFLRLSIRYLFRKNLVYTLINIVGLAIGFASFLVAILYSADELSFDDFHPNADQVYRLVVDWDGDGIQRNWASSSVPVGQVGDGFIPEITQRVRIRKNPGTDLITINDQSFYEPKLLMVEPAFFNLFGFTLETGDKEKVLSDKYSIVLTQETAKKYFGNQNPIGQIIRYDGQFDLKVTGIARNPPTQSHIQFDCLLSFELLDEIFPKSRLDHWGQFDHYTYVRLAENANVDLVESKMANYLSSQAPDWVSEKITLKLQPIKSIHLESTRQSELSPNSNKAYYLVFMSAAVLILLVASINYVNLSYATYLSRSKEMAMKKILGATKSGLLKGLIIESALISLSAMLLALFIVNLTIAEIGQITGKDFGQFHTPSFIFLTLSIGLITGLISGIPPALGLIKIQNHMAKLKSKPKSTMGHIMILIQLSVSSLLIMAMFAVTSQFNYLQNTSLGFNGARTLVIPIKDRSLNAGYQATVNEIKSISGIESASFSSTTPGTNNALTYTYSISGTDRNDIALTTVIADEFFYELYNIRLKAGRLPEIFAPGNEAQIVLSQAAVDFLDLKEPIGKTVSGKIKGTIVGVVEDFQVNSLHSKVEPIIMFNYLPTLRFVSVKTSNGFDQATIASLAKVWDGKYEKYPMEYSFLEDDNLKLYSYEQGVLNSIYILVTIAIFIASIGLVGHATLLRRNKAREYSIRKILGASSWAILTGSVKRIIPLFLIGAGITALIGYAGINSWLQSFAYRPSLGLSVIVIPLLAVLVLFLSVMSGLLLSQANKNPTRYLKEQ